MHDISDILRKNNMVRTDLGQGGMKLAEQMDTFDSIGFLHNEMLDYFGYFMRDTLNMYAERGEMNV